MRRGEDRKPEDKFKSTPVDFVATLAGEGQ
jgi:hypothetical protein